MESTSTFDLNLEPVSLEEIVLHVGKVYDSIYGRCKYLGSKLDNGEYTYIFEYIEAKLYLPERCIFKYIFIPTKKSITKMLPPEVYLEYDNINEEELKNSLR